MPERLTVALVSDVPGGLPELAGFAPRVCSNVWDIDGNDDVAVLYGSRLSVPASEFLGRRRAPGGPRLCAVATVFDPEDVVDALAAGVTSYGILSEWTGGVAEAVRNTANDVAVVTRSVLSVLRGHPRDRPPAAVNRAAVSRAAVSRAAANRAAANRAARSPLSRREHAVVDLLARGRSTAEIAKDLCLTTQTVRNYLSNAYAKLDTRGQAQTILRWLDRDPRPDGGFQPLRP